MSRKSFLIIIISLVIILAVAELGLQQYKKTKIKIGPPLIAAADSIWIPPDTSAIPHSAEGDLIRYGRKLISNTADFFGPGGSVAHLSNGMNCQNCHLEAGTKAWGNNYSAVFSTYPKIRDRRGGLENTFQRVNDCFQRSLNASSGLDSSSHEMQAILAYMKWVGKDVVKGKKPWGSGLQQPKLLNRPADPALGKMVYEQKCTKCHGTNGEGVLKPGTDSYVYPPLWGNHSYNTAAGLFRLSRFAGYAKNNMPLGTNYKSTQLTDEEAWDVAAYVNSQPRPQKSFAQDWPNIALKPFDHPFGPYVDSFSERQHKFGPFIPIQKAKENPGRKKAS